VKYVIIAVILMLPKMSSASEYDNRAFLFLDGKLLADHLLPEVCNDNRITDFSGYSRLNPFASGIKGFVGNQFGNNWRRLPTNSEEHEIEMFKKMIMEKPDDSVTPIDMAMMAISFTKGNVLNGLQLAYNVLLDARMDARDDRNKPTIANKLVDITGEQNMAREAFKNPKKLFSSNFVISTRGGKISNWYHFFGAAMIAYDEGTKEPPIKLSCDTKIKNAHLMGKMVAGTMVTIESALDKYFGIPLRQAVIESNLKREQNNYQGVEFGARLAQNVVSLKLKNNCSSLVKPNQPYLADRPELFPKDYPLRPNENPADRRRK
jgi:hypothetical protein